MKKVIALILAFFLLGCTTIFEEKKMKLEQEVEILRLQKRKAKLEMDLDLLDDGIRVPEDKDESQDSKD